MASTKAVALLLSITMIVLLASFEVRARTSYEDCYKKCVSERGLAFGTIITSRHAKLYAMELKGQPSIYAFSISTSPYKTIIIQFLHSKTYYIYI
jgi:hypothetical protein